MENYVFLWILGKSTLQLQMIALIIIIRCALCQTQRNIWQESLLCKLECSQAYHCWQMADQRSVEMLAFIFLSRIFALKRLAQGLSGSASAFSSFMREYLDPVVKTQYVADIGITASNATNAIRKVRAVF